jgi:BirA family transcriptional regulator, biotin operon repressor / biotin---[acetyl-CoA-carboxylase] ligase
MERPSLADLGTRLVGRYIRWHDSIPSTNDLALRLTQVPVPEGTVVVADEQTAGRGRLGRSWASPRGGVWLSVILSPNLPLESVPIVGFAAAIAAAVAIRKTTGLLARLKWPNDVLVDGKKVVGVLTEAAPAPGWVVVGIGMNANIAGDILPEVPGHRAASLQTLLGRPIDREALTRTLLLELDRTYGMLMSAGVDSVLRRWREMADTLGRPVRVEMPAGTICGIAQDVDGVGALRVTLADGTIQRVVAGDVQVRDAGWP